VDLDETIDVYHRALAEIVKGDPEPLKRLYHHGDDMTLANPWGPAQRGWPDVSAATDRAASQFRDGSPQSRPHERLALHADADLAYLVENECWQAKVSGRDEITPFELRVTTVFRREEDEWKIFHRHADPITTLNPDGVLGKPG
jgi:ketosteroid isomerase-like protein